jgi:hypothetical protein
MFGIRKRLDAIADEEAELFFSVYKPAHFIADDFDYAEHQMRTRMKARVQNEYGSALSMLLMMFLSRVIQLAIKRWLEKRTVSVPNGGCA